MGVHWTPMHFSALPHLHISILHEGGLTAAFYMWYLIINKLLEGGPV